MKLLALPVSGGGFVVQLAALQLLSTIRFVPDVSMGSSGGNLAAYVGAAANWRWKGIERIARQLSHHMFAQSWSMFRPLAFLIGYYKGELYDHGTGAEEFFRRHFACDTIQHYELWTGTYNQEHQRAQLFTNRRQGMTLLDPKAIDLEMTQCLEPVYTNGDFTLLSQVSVASASIPALVPAQPIFEQPYVDGGIASASPLTIMKESILAYIRKTAEPFHLIYLNSDDLDDPIGKTINNALDRGTQAVNNLIRAHCVIDREMGYSIVRHHYHDGTVNKDSFPCTKENLTRIISIWEQLECSMLEIYPTANIEVDITQFSGSDALAKIVEARTLCQCRLWWASEQNSSSIQQLIDSCKSSSSSSSSFSD
jgi:hypothetical protein